MSDANDDPKTQPLREWCRLARENTENDIISSIFEITGNSSLPVEKFSTWLLVGSAAIASFLIANMEQILEFYSKQAVAYMSGFLIISCALGLISRFFALLCEVQINISKQLRLIFKQHFDKYSAEEDEINESSKFWGITLDTAIRFDRILTEYQKPLPKAVTWYVNKKTKKLPNDPHLDQHQFMRTFTKQCTLAFLQAISFLGFLISGFFYVF